jgi:hypothetical protein
MAVVGFMPWYTPNLSVSLPRLCMRHGNIVNQVSWSASMYCVFLYCGVIFKSHEWHDRVYSGYSSEHTSQVLSITNEQRLATYFIQQFGSYMKYK